MFASTTRVGLIQALGLSGDIELTKLLFACFAVLLSSCATSRQPATLSFAEAYRAVENLPPDSYIDDYEQTWNVFNNMHQLDQKYGCYEKSQEAIKQVLVLNSTGKVVQYVSDQDTPRSRCFRKTYLGIQFPAPPVSPYYKYALMR